jgi:ankyrin repeat protein
MFGEEMSTEGARRLFLVRLVPALMLISFVAWCSSSNRARHDVQPVILELRELFMTNGLIEGGPSNVSLPDVAKSIGETGMNRLLYEAAPEASLDALKWLVKHGAVPANVGAMRDLTLLQRAAALPRYERLEYFISQGLDPLERGREATTVMHYAAKGGIDERSLGLLVAKGLTVSDTDNLGRQPIHFASVKSIQVLANSGADINAKDKDGRTALHVAAQDGRNDLVAELLRFNASVFDTDNRGRTPLHLAAMATNHNADTVIETLLAAGALKSARDADGMTARDIAQDARENNNSRYVSTIDKL